MNRAFGTPEIRRLTHIFMEKSLELRDIWEEQIHSQGGTANIDVMPWLNRVTLDIIGLAGELKLSVYKNRKANSEIPEASTTTSMPYPRERIVANSIASSQKF